MMKLVRGIYNWMIKMSSSEYAMFALFAIAFIESSIFPIPPDIMIIPMVLAVPHKAWKIAGLATIASVLGGYFGYAIGFLGYELIAEPLLEFYGYIDKFDEFQQYYHKWDVWIVFFGGITPFPYKIITIASGALDLNLWVFGIASVFARGIRFFIIAWLLKKYGSPIRHFIEKHLGLLTILFFVLLLGSFMLVKYI